MENLSTPERKAKLKLVTSTSSTAAMARVMGAVALMTVV